MCSHTPQNNFLQLFRILQHEQMIFANRRMYIRLCAGLDDIRLRLARSSPPWSRPWTFVTTNRKTQPKMQRGSTRSETFLPTLGVQGGSIHMVVYTSLTKTTGSAKMSSINSFVGKQPEEKRLHRRPSKVKNCWPSCPIRDAKTKAPPKWQKT